MTKTNKHKTPKRKKKTEGKQKRKKYSMETLKNALEEIRNGRSKNSVSTLFQIPRSTLLSHLKNPHKNVRPGPTTVLSFSEEESIVQWIKVNCKKGFPKRKEDVIVSVGEFIKKNKRQTPFKNGLPGEKWYQLFLKRHPDIVSRTPESATGVSESNIRHWFQSIEEYLKTESYDKILDDPSRILNSEETNFLLCPKSGKVLSYEGAKNADEVDQGQAKSSLTVMFSFKADGEQTPPLIIYPNKSLPKYITASVPDDWGIGLSENGRMKKEIFMDYIEHVLHPHLIKTRTQFPVILFVDGHKTHVTLEVSQLCTKLQVILIALYPSAARILQPTEVAAFKPLKTAWRKSVLEWRRTHPTQALTKFNFAGVLKDAINHSLHSTTLQNGFKATGLFPWNPDNIDFTKCLSSQTKPHEKKDETATSSEIQMDRNCFLRITKECRNKSNDQNTIKEDILKTIFNYFKVSLDSFIQSSTPKSDFDYGTAHDDQIQKLVSPQVEEQIDNENLSVINCDEDINVSLKSPEPSYLQVAHNVEVDCVPAVDLKDMIYLDVLPPKKINEKTKGKLQTDLDKIEILPTALSINSSPNTKNSMTVEKLLKNEHSYATPIYLKRK